MFSVNTVFCRCLRLSLETGKNMHTFTRLCFLLMLLFSLMIAGVLIALCLPVSANDLFSALCSRETFFALQLSFFCAVSATILSLLWGVPTGYILARISFKGKFLIDTLVDIPMTIPPLVTGVGLLFLFGGNGLGNLFADWGIRVLFTPLGAIVAQTFIAVPIIIRTSRSAFESVDTVYESVARTLGSSTAGVFFKITVPLARHGILSGAALAMARAMGEFGATLMVAGTTRLRTETLPIAVFLNISSGQLETALACAWILIGAGLLLLILIKFCSGIYHSDINAIV